MLSWVAMCIVSLPLFAQQAPAPTANAAPPPVAIPLAEVTVQAESATNSLHEINADTAADQLGTTITAELASVSRDVDMHLNESAKNLARNPSLETLRSLEVGWQTTRAKLADWTRDLSARAEHLEQDLTRLDGLEKTWNQTLALTKLPATPPEVSQRIRAVLGAIRQTRAAVERQRAQTLSLQVRVADEDTRVNEELDAVRQARAEARDRLLVMDSPPLWSAEVRSRSSQAIVEESQSSFSAQIAALKTYAERETLRLVVHAAVFALLAVGLVYLRKFVRVRSVQDPALGEALLIFNLPIATALLLAILASGWLYPQAPRLLWMLLGAAALVPTVLILRRVAESQMFPILNALVAFYLLDQVRALVASFTLASRLFFIAEMLAAIAFLTWLAKSIRLPAPTEAGQRRGIWLAIRIGARISIAALTAALIANAVGFVSLANLLGNAVLGSAYVAVILYAAVGVADALFTIALRLRPLVLLVMVRRHRSLLRARAHWVLRGIALVLWVLFVLEQLSLRTAAIERATTILTSSLKVGSLNVSLGDVLAFGIAIWAAFVVSKFVRFLLEEDVYPRLDLARGLPYAVSTVLNYAILVVGFFFAVAALGIDMTRFTILAGAFTVGLGFGLQNIVNNFVSGLILLFERPIKLGDVLQMDDATGVVERIGIRASVIRTTTGSEIIMPNARLISERVINWTLSDPQRSIEIAVGVAPDSDPPRVVELLVKIADAHAHVLDHPAPRALLVKLGADSLSFELRVWTDQVQEWTQVRSELALAINAALRSEKIAVR